MIMDKNTCKKLDKILDSMRSEETGCIFDFRKFYWENFIKEYSMHPQTYDSDINYLKSKLIEDGKAEHITNNKNSLRIKDAGRVFKGYCKERYDKILSNIGKYILWICAVLAGIWAAIRIFNLCKCYL
jgi:hypothetical protein